MNVVLDFWVLGNPKTTGCIVVVNGRRGVLREGVVGSKRWRSLVGYAAIQEMGRQPGIDWPLLGPVTLTLAFSLPVDDAIQARAGDIDKLYRNVLDALT